MCHKKTTPGILNGRQRIKRLTFLKLHPENQTDKPEYLHLSMFVVTHFHISFFSEDSNRRSTNIAIFSEVVQKMKLQRVYIGLRQNSSKWLSLFTRPLCFHFYFASGKPCLMSQISRLQFSVMYCSPLLLMI